MAPKGGRRRLSLTLVALYFPKEVEVVVFKWATGILLAFAFVSTAAGIERRGLDAQTYYSALRSAKGHPNELARWRGLWSYSNGKYSDARRQLERAAYYGDKPAQLVLSMMYWHGDGVAADPVLAYIWADLATERGVSKKLLLMREKIWSQLSGAQQKRAVEEGRGYYARYGDHVAMARTNVQLVRFSRNRTGSRTGSSAAPLSVTLGAMGPSGVCATQDSDSRLDVTPVELYADNRVQLDEYWKEQDVAMQRLLVGYGIAGDLQPVGPGN